MAVLADFDSAVESVAKELVKAHWHAGAHYINLPMLYPDGSSVTVRVDQPQNGIARVSDNGFAYREVEAVGAEASFPGTAAHVAEKRNVESNRRAVFAEAPVSQLHRAICDVAVASWEIVDRIYSRISERDETEVEQKLRDRLASVFGPNRLQQIRKLQGASSSDWDVSAIVKTNGSSAVFQVVSDHPNSIFRTATAFHDLAALEHAPRLIAVVEDKGRLGAKLGLLSQAGRVIEEGQRDEVFRRAVV